MTAGSYFPEFEHWPDRSKDECAFRVWGLHALNGYRSALAYCLLTKSYHSMRVICPS